MRFALQSTLINENTITTIKNVLLKHNIPHVLVEMLPFSNTFDTSLVGTEYLPYGSTSFTMATYDRGWLGQYFSPVTYDTDVWLDNRDDMLNDMRSMSLVEAISFLKTQPADSEWFVRPCEDTKTFSGQVIQAQECIDWFVSATECESEGSYAMSKDMRIIVSKPRKIQAEWRYFIVDGKIIDGSMYRFKGELYKEHVEDAATLEEAQQFADKWLPHPNCVMDLCLVDGEVKVVEFNTINSSGFYDNDVEKIILSLWDDFVKYVA